MSQLPAGWSLSNLGVLTQTKSGNSKLIKGKLSAEPTGDAPFPAFSASGQDVWTSTPEHSGDAVIVSAVGARCGKAFLASGEWSAIANTHVVWPKPGFLNVRLLWYRINDESFWVKGGSAQPFVKVGATFESPFALPPASEQKRIADKLDTVLTRVEAVNTRLARVAPILKRFRQSVLAAATSGRLTEDWRDANRAAAWTPRTVESLCLHISDGPFGSNLKSDDYTDAGARVVRLENIGHLSFDAAKETFISQDKYETLKKHTLLPGDLLFSSFVDEEVRVCEFPADIAEPTINKADCFCVRVDKAQVDPRFLAFRLACKSTYQALKDLVHGATRPRINLRQLRGFEVMLPTADEQTEIVRRVETLFAFADRLEARLQTAQTATERLTPALLAKAFRGELVPQDPNDEPASELLKRLAASTPASTPKRGRPKVSTAT